MRRLTIRPYSYGPSQSDVIEGLNIKVLAWPLTIHKLNTRQEIEILELLTKLPWGEAKINQCEFSQEMQ